MAQITIRPVYKSKEYWGKSFYDTHLGDIKVLLWSILNRKDISLTRIRFRLPKIKCREVVGIDQILYTEIEILLPIYIDVDMAMIEVCGSGLGIPYWDIPF